eukprot:1048378-Pelagomonas_calceolata.AAC.1
MDLQPSNSALTAEPVQMEAHPQCFCCMFSLLLLQGKCAQCLASNLPLLRPYFRFASAQTLSNFNLPLLWPYFSFAA